MKFDKSRRTFAKSSALGLGSMGIPLSSRADTKVANRLPREVWITTISTMGLTAENPAGMVDQVLKIMEKSIPHSPDIICLPEGFAFTHISQKINISEVAEDVPGPIIQPFLKFARENKCYIICPTYTREGGRVFIAAVLINREGIIVGEYRKARPTVSEMESGVAPGAVDPPIFETDFGKIGIQICFDVKWEDGWKKLQEKGAEIIFWPSAYAGGQEISSRAWRHQVYIVTSTLKDTSKICDLTGEALVSTNRWQRNWVGTSVNLEKAFFSCWPAALRFGKMQEKYGRKIRLRVHDEEEWATLESLDHSILVADVMKEFDIMDHDELIKHTASQQQNKK